MKNKYILFLLILCFVPFQIFSQDDYEKKYVTVIPGEQYKAGWFYEWLFGKHWRDVWTTPVKVEILDLEKFDGGLTPIRIGGGLQTKSLRLQGADGRVWKFRSVNKDPTKALPKDFQDSFASDIIQDQISSSNPMAALVVAPILDAVGVLEAKPYLFYMPDDKRLGEFRKDFAGVLGMIEVHPNEYKDFHKSFGGALEVKGTYGMYHDIEKKRWHKVDAAEFLKARLVDIFVGDWDRHTDQWRWAKYQKGREKVWLPIPRDRDQAFAKFDGLLPHAVALGIHQLNDFDYEFPSVQDITWNGRPLDWRILPELDKRTWDSVTAFVYGKLTNDVIHDAVKHLPPEYYPIAGYELESKMLSRRDQLPKISNDYYNHINKFIDIYGSRKNDFAFVNRIDDKQTLVELFKRNKKTGEKEGPPYFHKIFDNNLALDIRIYLMEGDDKAVIKGDVYDSPHVRVIGGKGKDELIDSSKVTGYFLKITPFQIPIHRTYFYDSGKRTLVTMGPSTSYDADKFPEPKDDIEKYEPLKRDKGHEWFTVPILSYDVDRGIIFGGGVRLEKYNFRQFPREYDMSLLASYGSRAGGFTFNFRGNYYSLIKNGWLNINVIHTTLYAINYFGYGNETNFDTNLEKDDFFRVNQTLITVFPRFYYNFSEHFVGRVGISFNYTETHMNNISILDNARFGDYGINKLNPLGIHAGVELDRRNNKRLATEGYYVDLKAAVFPKIFNVDEPFYRAEADIRKFIPFNLLEGGAIALRVGGEKVWGKYPFSSSAFLGGYRNLRGYNNWRFAGDASVFGQLEGRLLIAPLKIIFKSKLGMNVFAETGRVFARGESSSVWHPSYGAGIWLTYFNSTLIVNATMAFSPDRSTFGFHAKMAF